MIVKIQISLNTNAAERQVLVYDESREYFAKLPLSACPGLEVAMLDTAPAWRAFYDAEIVNDKLSIGRRLPEQGW